MFSYIHLGLFHTPDLFQMCFCMHVFNVFLDAFRCIFYDFPDAFQVLFSSLFLFFFHYTRVQCVLDAFQCICAFLMRFTVFQEECSTFNFFFTGTGKPCNWPHWCELCHWSPYTDAEQKRTRLHVVWTDPYFFFWFTSNILKVTYPSKHSWSMLYCWSFFHRCNYPKPASILIILRVWHT